MAKYVSGRQKNLKVGISSYSENLTSLEVIGSAVFSGESSGELVRISQIGTGPALIVEDSANPDTTPFAVTTDGRVAIGLGPSGISTFYKLEVDGNGNGGGVRFVSGGQGDLIFSHSNLVSNIRAAGSVQLGLGANGEDAIRINLNNNVGIGTTVPTSKLYVVGDGYFTGVITATQFSTGSGTLGFTTNTISGPSEIIIDPAPVGVGTTSGVVRIKGDLYVDGTQFIVSSETIELADFNVGIASTVGTNALLDGAGIGIGSVNIRKTLTYASGSDSLKSSENFDLASGKTYKINAIEVLSSTTIGSGVTNSSLTSVGTLGQLNVSGVSTFSNNIIQTSGSVGLGTTNPLQRLQIGTANTLGVNTTGTVFVVTSNADVGIGTTNPTTKLDVRGNVNISGVVTASSFVGTLTGTATTATNVIGGIGSITQLSVSGVSTFSSNIIQTSGSVGLGTTNPLQRFQIGTANTLGINTTGTVFVVTSNADVGIGTTNPTTKLDVRGNVNISGVVTATTFVGTLSGFASTSGVSTSVIGGIASVTQLSVTGVSTFSSNIIQTSGSVGLGTTNPLQRLQIGTANTLGINTTGTVFVVTSNADVGIGTTNPIAKLDVRGNVNITGVVTASSFSGNASITQLSVSGISTIGTLGVSGVTTTQHLNVSGIATLGFVTTGNVFSTGVVTATTFFGDQVIGTPTGGFKTGAVGIVTSDYTKNSINDINFILGKLVPRPPTTINGQTLVNTNVTTRKICNFVFTNNTGDASPAAGSDLVRNTTTLISSQYLTEFGPGDSGTVTGYINSTGIGTTTLTTGSNNGTYGSLQIANDKDAYLSSRNTGIASGFYEVYDVRITSANSPSGYNKAYIIQVDGSNTYTTTSTYWYEDPSTVTAPVLSFGSTITPASPVLSYSSGIPHYTESASNAFTYVLTCLNATGDMYTTNTFCTTGGATNGFQTPGNKSYTDFAGGTNPPARNFGVGTGVTALISQTPVNTHIQVSSASDKFSTFTASTPYGTSAASRGVLSQTINIMGTTATTSKIDEDNILISSLGTGSGNSIRVNAGLGVSNPTPIYTSWTPNVSVGTSEATVVGGVLKHDQINYSTGYLPVGPDYSSGRSAAQYFQVQLIRSNVSQFKINVTGTYAGCWVCMPDNSAWTTSLSTKNGWGDMFLAYRGSGLPTNSEPGCSFGGVMSGSTGNFTCVFGTESSSNDTNNRILVRFQLNSGQSITALSFSS